MLCPAIEKLCATERSSGMADEVARYLRLAEQCRGLAAKDRDPVDEEAWLKLAEEWLKFAHRASGRAAAD